MFLRGEGQGQIKGQLTRSGTRRETFGHLLGTWQFWELLQKRPRKLDWLRKQGILKWGNDPKLESLKKKSFFGIDRDLSCFSSSSFVLFTHDMSVSLRKDKIITFIQDSWSRGNYKICYVIVEKKNSLSPRIQWENNMRDSPTCFHVKWTNISQPSLYALKKIVSGLWEIMQSVLCHCLEKR